MPKSSIRACDSFLNFLLLFFSSIFYSICLVYIAYILSHCLNMHALELSSVTGGLNFGLRLFLALYIIVHTFMEGSSEPTLVAYMI